MSVLELHTAPAPAGDRHALLPCEVYQAWRAACEDADRALAAWCAVPQRDKGGAYAAYRAAADREDAAADRWMAV